MSDDAHKLSLGDCPLPNIVQDLTFSPSAAVFDYQGQYNERSCLSRTLLESDVPNGVVSCV